MAALLPPDVPPHVIDRTPEYQHFMARLKDYHNQRGTQLDPEPKVGSMYLDLFKVFNHIITNGGYDKISEEKLAWRRMAWEMGIHSHNEASTAFALKEKFYKNLAAFEISTVHGKEPPPKDILEDVTAKGAGLLSRTRDNFRSKRESNIGPDSTASGDEATPSRERPIMDNTSSARVSRGLREAPTQRVIFQPDTASSRLPRHPSAHNTPIANHTSSPNLASGHIPMAQPSMMTPAGLGGSRTTRAPSIIHNPIDDTSSSHMVNSYQPLHTKPLQLRAVATPSNTPSGFPRFRIPHRPSANGPGQPMQPGVGFDGPNIYMRCLNALRSGIPSEQAFALNHLVKISFERGDKYRFDSFPGLAEGLIGKALEVGNIFYYIKWHITWDYNYDRSDIGALDGDAGTHDIAERIENLVEKEALEALQPELYADRMLLVTEAVLTIRNMVTLPDNAHHMSDFPPLKDLLCIILHLPGHDSLTELKHLALDIAEQLTPYMTLDADDPLYKALLSQLYYEDRGVILTALRALGRISMNLQATNTLGSVPHTILQRIASWLLLNDDELMDACLDFLYQYTAVVSNVENLVCSDNPEGLVGQLVRLLSHGARKFDQEIVLTPEEEIQSQGGIAAMPDDLMLEMLKIEEPNRVHQWVKCFFEEDSTSFVTQLAAWQAYQSAFVAPLKFIGQPLITPADFIRNSTSVYKESNAQVLREPGDTQQKFIIHGLRARPLPLTIQGSEYGRCLFAVNDKVRTEKCGQLFSGSKGMWNHILTDHVSAQKNEEGLYENKERLLKCTWGDCRKYNAAASTPLHDFSRHINTHISEALSGSAESQQSRRIIPAKVMSISYEETMTVRDERNPNALPQAAGIPLSAVLVLRNIARNVVKTDAEEILKGKEGLSWNDKLFQALQPRFFQILAENQALSPYITSLLELIQRSSEEGNS